MPIALKPLPTDTSHLVRSTTTVLPPTDKTPSFVIGAGDKSYRHQYSNIYFVRLRHLREHVESNASKRWPGKESIPRVLEVIKSQVCYIIGTVYMEMPLKPNVMEDIARDHSISAPPPPPKIYSPEDNIMLEDESGRIRLIGDAVKKARLVTGVIIGALGAETAGGDFEVIDICFPGLPPQPQPSSRDEDTKMDVDNATDDWVALVSGLNVGSTSSSDTMIQLLVEYLSGEGGGEADQLSSSAISRLIIAGNSIAPLDDGHLARNMGIDPGSAFTPHPTHTLSGHLHDIAQVMPIHLLAGETDPSGTIIPQQALPRGMFAGASSFASFVCETNPTYLRLDPLERTLLINSGQPLNDMFKYLPSPPHTRLDILESTLKWRHIAPTAPDTLWCHPYFASDPFIIAQTPDLYIVGGQKKFGTRLVQDGNRKCRMIMIPDFSKTGTLVVANLKTLEVRTISFHVSGLAT